MPVATKTHMTDCGAITLLASIFGKDVDTLKIRYGLPTSQRCCIKCGRHIYKNSRTGLCMKCYKDSKRIQVACSCCGKLTEILTSTLIHNFNHPGPNNKIQQFTFCSQKCKGKFIGENYGFKAHPENRIMCLGYRKHDWDYVWQKHLETGYGARRLNRLLNIPEATISMILKKIRQKEADDANRR